MILSLFKKQPVTETVPAADLLSPFRLDLAVKFMLFRSFGSGIHAEAARALYVQHILARTGGKEPPDYDGTPSTKNSADRYIEAAEELYSSMRDKGFDPRFSIPMGTKQLPLNAAHRIACATSLGLDVAVQRCPEDGYPWDFKWFCENGFSKSQLSLILKEYAVLTSKRTVVFTLWGPALKYWDQLSAEIGKDFQIAGHIDFAFGQDEAEAFRSLVYDVYSYELYDQLSGLGHIDKKLGFLEAAPSFYRVVVASLPADRSDGTWQLSRCVKDRMRQSVGDHVPVERFITCHASETEQETRHMAETLLDPWNLAMVRERKSAKPRDEFLQWLGTFCDKVKALNISREDCCIVGSSSLEVCGIRLSTDIDFTVRKDVRDAFFSAESQNIEKKLDVVLEGYHRLHLGEPYTDNRLIDDSGLHFRFRGLKFASLPVVRDRKHHSARPKDLLDVELIDRWKERRATESKII